MAGPWTRFQAAGALDEAQPTEHLAQQLGEAGVLRDTDPNGQIELSRLAKRR
jgi:hypothetical protein